MSYWSNRWDNFENVSDFDNWSGRGYHRGAWDDYSGISYDFSHVVTFQECKLIFDKLPISFYTGVSGLRASLDPGGDTSYFNPDENTLFVSYENVVKTLERKKKVAKKLDSKMLEECIRAIMYHEVLHSILSPRVKVTDKFNIFEDERIETLGKNTFTGVNFKENCLFLNGYESFDNIPTPSTAVEAFYHVVRFRKGPEPLVRRVEQIIIMFADITAGYDPKDCRVDNYINSIKELYNDVCAAFKVADPTTFNLPPIKLPEMEIANTFGTDKHIKSVAKQMFKNNVLESKEYRDLKSIVDTAQRRKMMLDRGGVGYSGIFNANNLMYQKQTFRWWTQDGDDTSGVTQRPIKINLIIDNSGSFAGNDRAINHILNTLRTFEAQHKRELSYMIATLGDDVQVQDKTSYRHNSDGGTRTSYLGIKKAIAQMSDPEADEVFIICVDGSCGLWDNGYYHHSRWVEDKNNNNLSKYKYPHPWSLFNSKRFYIISEKSNEQMIRDVCPEANTMIENKAYAEKLWENIYKALEKRFR